MKLWRVVIVGLIVLCSVVACRATVTVTASLVDPSGSTVPISFLRLQLRYCGFNIPDVPSVPNSIVLKQIDVPVAQLPIQIYANNEITCGNSYSTLWHITAFSDSRTPILGDYDYQLVAGTTFNLATGQPFTGTPPPPGFRPIFGNPTQSQVLTQPAGTSIVFNGQGQFDFTNANLLMPQKADLIGGLVPSSELGTGGTGAGTKCLLDNQTFGTCGSGGGGSGNATALQGVPILSTAPTNGQILGFNGTSWLPTSGAAGNPSTPLNSLQWNSASSFGGAYGTSWTAGGTANTYGTLSVADLEHAKYADQYNWSQLLASNVSVGANTVTLTPCPNGFSGTITLADQLHYVYLAGGTPEAVLITAASGAGGAASCTITFTAANTHSSGTTIQSASGGIKEASVAASFAPTNPTGSIQSGYVIVPPTYEANIYGPLYITATLQTLQFSGSIENCLVTTASCIIFGDATPGSQFNGEDITAIGIRCRAMVASTHPCIEDNGYHVTLYNVTTRNKSTGAYFSPFLIQFDNDQSAVLDGLDQSIGTWEPPCTATSCGTTIGLPTGVAGATVLAVSHWNGSFNCHSNGLLDQQGNQLKINDSVLQGYPEFGIAATNTYNTHTSFFDNVYEEAGGCVNPMYGGSITARAGLIEQNGLGSFTGVGPSGAVPTFASSTSGTTKLDIYVVINSTTYGRSVPLYAGVCATNGTGTCSLQWPEAGTAGTITYDVLGTTRTISSVPAPPTGTGNFALTTGVTTAACVAGSPAGMCAFTVSDVSATPSSYTVLANVGYFPLLTFWPGDVVLSANIDVNVAAQAGKFSSNAMAESTGGGIVSVLGWMWPSVRILTPSSSIVPNGSVWIQSPTQDSANPTALILSSGGSSYDTGLTGVIGFPTNGVPAASFATELITLGYGNTASLFSSGLSTGQRVTMNNSDTFLGLDQTTAVAPTAYRLAMGSPLSVSEYVGHTPDGTSWKNRQTSTLFEVKTDVQFDGKLTLPGSGGAGEVDFPQGTLPTVTVNSVGLVAPTSVGTAYQMVFPGAAGTGFYKGANSAGVVTMTFDTTPASMQDCGTTTTCANTSLTSPRIVTGKTTLSGGTATVSSISPVFASTTIMRCWAGDTTTATNLATAVPASTSSVTLTGTGTDVLEWGCSGN